MELAHLSTTGKVRTKNEDTVLLVGNAERGLAVVADGMGGHAAGDIASAIVREVFEASFSLMPNRPMELSEWIEQRVAEANARILQFSKDEQLAIVGTTIACVCWVEDLLVIGHVGDSRVYALEGTALKQLTDDHSYVNMLRQMGELSDEEVENHPRKNVITRSVGSNETVEVDIQVRDAPDYDLVLVCSDGLTDEVPDDVIEQIILQDEPLDEIVGRLVKEANARGGADNITIAAVRFKERKRV